MIDASGRRWWQDGADACVCAGACPSAADRQLAWWWWFALSGHIRARDARRLHVARQQTLSTPATVAALSLVHMSF